MDKVFKINQRLIKGVSLKNMYPKLPALLFFILSVGLSSCFQDSDDLPQDPAESLLKQLSEVDTVQLKKDIAIIDDSLAAHNIEFDTEPYGVRYRIETLGTGSYPPLNSNVIIKYKGRFLNDGIEDKGIYFDENIGGIAFYLPNLIMGWQLTLPLLPTNTKVTLYIPSGYAYGSSGNTNGGIPPNANLIFEIELIDFY